ncbi:MAG: serine--tRNA ligase, partial [Candidatus Bipolaricaulota bacterium]
MLDIERIRENPAEIEKRLKSRQPDVQIDRILELDEKRRRLITEVEELRHERNEKSKKIGKLKQEGKETEAEELIQKMGGVSDRIGELEDDLEAAETELQAEMARLPNIPHESVPVSNNERDKEVLAEYGEKPSFDFEPKNHLELGAELDLFRFDKASKISGSRFPFYYGDGALLEMGLINFMYFYQV